MQWELTECDINKDIKVSDLLHFTGIKIQVKHLDHLFRIYIKAKGKDTVCRVEENKHPKKRAVEFINDVFNSPEKLESYLKEYDKKLDQIIGILNASQFDVLDKPQNNNQECIDNNNID